MRPYRGIPIYGKDFVYGWYIKLGNHHLIADETTDWDNAGEVGVIEIEGLIEVIPETLGQQTGLRDKNGTKIYRGDICKVLFGEQELIYVCEWYEEIGAWVFRGNGEWLMWEDVFETCEIIGNKAQNPDLLEQDNG